MNTFSSIFLALLVGLFVGYSFGWSRAHKVIAIECERLGGFFVGKKIFRCQSIEKAKEVGL